MPEFIGYIEADTGRAILFHDHYWCQPDWLPKSQAEIIRDPETTEVKVIASNWICGQKGIKEFEFRDCPPEEEDDGTQGS